MGTGAEFIAVAAIVGSVASTGVAMYGQMQQAQAAAQMAAYNQNLQMQAAQIAANNAMVQNQLMSQQNALAQQQALASQNAIAKNMQMSQQMNLLNQRNLQSRSDSQIMAMQNNALIAQRNAASQDQEANLVEAQARERARRQREQNEKIMSSLRGRQGKSAVTFEGSPLMVMAETAGLMELGVADAFYEAGLQSQALRTKADAGRYGSALELWQTRFVGQDAMMDGQVMDLKAQAELSNLNLERQSAQYELAAAQYQGSAIARDRQMISQKLTYDMNAARGTYMQGMNQSQAYQIDAYGTLFGGMSQAGQLYSGYRRDVKSGAFA
jgi:hypothetical protein